MAVKRNADKELTDRNWDEAEEPEEAGRFKMASKDDLGKRKIIRAKRRGLVASCEGQQQSTPVDIFKGLTNMADFNFHPNKEAFAGFCGLAGSNKPLVGLKGTESTSSAEQSAPGTLLENKVTEEIAVEGIETTPIGTEIQEVAAMQTEHHQEEIHIEPVAPQKPPASKDRLMLDTSNIQTKGELNQEYLKQIRLLNESVSTWIKSHVDQDPHVDLMPIFRDYERYMEEIDEKYGTAERSLSTDIQNRAVLNEEVMADTQTSTWSAYTFKKTSSVSSVEHQEGGNSTEVANVPLAAATEETTNQTAAFGADYFKPPMTDAGATTQEACTEQEADANQQQETESIAHSDEPDDTPKTKSNVQAAPEAGSLYNVRCKVFFKRQNNWAEMGVGMLSLKECRGKIQLVVRNDSALGIILLNILLQPNTPVSRSGKNNILLVSVPNPPVFTKPEEGDNSLPVTYLIRVKTFEDASELYKQLTVASKGC